SASSWNPVVPSRTPPPASRKSPPAADEGTDLTAQAAAKPLVDDLRRMAPVLAVVTGTALLVILTLPYTARRHLQSAVVSTGNPCDYARLFFAAGDREMDDIRSEAFQKHVQDNTLNLSALG